MRALFAEVRRVLADDGTLWLNIGDSYASGSTTRTLGRNDKGRDFGSGNTGQGAAASPGNQGTIAAVDGIPAKNLLGIPWKVAFALQDDGWILRNDIIWAKPNAMPESVTDRLSTKHEHLFMFAKRPRYFFDLDPIREPLARPEALDEGIVFGGKNPDVGERRGSTYKPRKASKSYQAAYLDNRAAPHSGYRGTHEQGRNPGDVWSIPTQPYPGAHFAVMPQTLASRAIQAGCKPGGTVLDPFSGSGTTGLAAAKHGRKYVGIDLNREYLDLSLKTRLAQPALMDYEVD